MKAVQVTLDEELLRQLARDREVKKIGRSAFIRGAIRDYLKRREDAEIAAAFRRAYREHPETAKERKEIDRMIGSQAWPEE